MSEAQERCSSAEFVYWTALWNEAPWGTIRQDALFGLLGSNLGNLWIAKGQRLKPQDFIPAWKKAEPKKQSIKAARAQFIAWAQSVNGVFKRDG